jgi:hypothetical protein
MDEQNLKNYKKKKKKKKKKVTLTWNVLQYGLEFYILLIGCRAIVRINRN